MEEVEEERFELRWRGKRAAAALARQPSTATLRPLPEESLDWETTGNLLIEGDNLEALKLLEPRHGGTVKLAYLDPPYNTGRGFSYGDRFAAAGEGRHDAWLSMIYPRLMLVRRLLRDDGVLLVHVDEHEVDTLSLLLKELFGEINQLGTIVWDKRNPKGDARGIATCHEYILAFAKDRELLLRAGPLQRPKRGATAMLAQARRLVAGSRDLETARAEFRAWVAAQPDLAAGERMYNRLDSAGRVYRLVSMAWPNKTRAPDPYFEPLIHPVTGRACPVPERGWRNPPATMAALLDAGLIEFGRDHGSQPQRIYYLDENPSERIASIVRHGGSDDARMARYGMAFDHPKPLALATDLVAWFTGPGDLVLDCFAGSGTAGHAVLAQNASDRGGRRYLLIQTAEPLDPAQRTQRAAAMACDTLGASRTIVALTKHRLRKAAEEIRGFAGAASDDMDTGFRVYRVARFNTP